MSYEKIKQTARLKAEELHEEWLEARINSKLSDGDLERELFNDDIGESELKEQIGLGRLDENQLVNAYTDLMYIALKRRSHTELRNTDNLLLTTDTATKCKTPNKTHKIRLEDKLEAFLNDKKAKKSSIKESSLEEYRLAVQELIEIHGNVNVCDIHYDQATDYRDIMRRLPKHRNKRKAYRNKTIQELLLLDIPDTDLLTAKTINGRLDQLSSYFDWLERCGDISKNPFRGLRMEATPNSYAPYTTNDLSIIFSSSLFVNSPYSRRKTTNQSHWWLIVLAAFTGARISELMQMRLEDITKSGNILSMAVTDDGEGMSVKTSAGKRKFPVPPTLLNLGFGEYIENIRRAGAKTILPGIIAGEGKAGAIASKWFGSYKKSHLPTSFSEEGKVFHSFRHTFINNALQCGIELTKLQQIVGHEAKLLGETATYKGDGYSQSQLLGELNLFEYPNLDLNPLINDWKRLEMM